MVLSVRVKGRGSICKAESLSSSQDRTNMHDWVTVLVREERMCNVKTFCALQGRTYRTAQTTN